MTLYTAYEVLCALFTIACVIYLVAYLIVGFFVLPRWARRDAEEFCRKLFKR